MAFIQIIEFDSSRIDEMRALNEDWEKRAAKDMSARRAITTENRDRPGHYMQIVFFDSYEDAMQNSELPVTQELAEQMGKLANGAPAFHNLDVLDDRTP